MTESEDGEWVRHEDYKKLIEDYKAQEQFTWELMQEEQARKWKAQDEVEFLWLRVRVLNGVLMATYGGIVAKLIAWSLGL